ncbi:hypothetical protein BS50DRAFT_604914 [Corynespora cassiicola Philippines]|uniref:DUF7587 domain-containing protein n=1 Tax=Corynespora cassiicola Philippines TaxID=1448308 RepID=A0A2T2N475_CORCC|nr:hypothetical protein BS50DRAFT_604914 [Corynespora cassiicola Philippines]
MGTNVEEIAGSVRDLSIVDAAQDRGQEPLRPARSRPASLQDAVHRLIRYTNTIESKVQSVKSLVEDANSSGNLPITEVCSLTITSNIRTTIDALNEAIETSVITNLKSLGNQSSTVVPKILSHFDEQIKDIVREVLNKTSNSGEVLWKVAEECYKQVTSSSGVLHADDYFVPLEEASLGWPYDHDYEREEYYEHESRLEVNELYAAAFQKKIERKLEADRKSRQSWTDFWTGFWVRVLNSSPGGPTLFYPPASCYAQSLNFDAVPKYLFRTFDSASSGINDKSVIASTASKFGSQGKSLTDILTLERDSATDLLHTHLKKSCFEGYWADNLMSWTSSLLFAIQYAVWRAERPGNHSHSTSDIKICVVDTEKFPRGQFMQDLYLLKTYHATAKELGGSTESFFKFRFNREDYYNGEYLSQGAVNHAGRSCVGLSQLYPEFEDAKGNEKWAKRALELRNKWSAEQETADEEIRLALQVGRNCFTRFKPSDIATILLSFKNRKYTRQHPTSK